MGQVVELERAGPASGRRRRGRRRPRTALVLGGGGFTGAVYEIGALRALNLLATNRSVNEFDVYVGTSAGAFVAALLANGVTPETMMRTVAEPRGATLPDLDISTLLRPNLRGAANAALRLPGRTVRVLRDLAPQLRQATAMDLLFGLGEVAPAGLYTGTGMQRWIARVLAEEGRSDDFRELRADLFVAATDLDTCERVVLGGEGWDDVPISVAVHASAAMPMVYEPVRVKGRELVDGGIVSTTNLDLAVAAGARLVVVINPLVPYVNDFTRTVRTLRGRRPRHVSDMGLAQVGYQAFKLVAHQRLHEKVREWERRYPGVDVVLVEPELDDELMFQTSVLNFRARVEIARHGFESVTHRLAADYEHLREVAERHEIDISPVRVRRVLRQVEGAEREGTATWRRILEQTTGALLRQSAS
jgi:predicted acylesterase/phospholipase RssA